MKKGLDERIDEGVLRWLAVWRGWREIGLPRESMYVGECADSHSAGRPQKR